MRESRRARELAPSRDEGNSIVHVDLRDHNFSYQLQLEVAKRAVQRFRTFQNGPITPQAVEFLIDDFLVAAQAITHVRDWVHAAEKTQKMSASLKAFVSTPLQGAIADIAARSKHGPRRNDDRYKAWTTGPLALAQRGEPMNSAEFSMGDLYARVVVIANGNELHPGDMLSAALHEWEQYCWDHLGIEDLHARLAGKARQV